MAQNECQKYSDINSLYSHTRNTLSTFYNGMDGMKRLSIFLQTADAETYPAIPGATLTAFGQLRTALNNHIAAAETVALMGKIEEFIQILR